MYGCIFLLDEQARRFVVTEPVALTPVAGGWKFPGYATVFTREGYFRSHPTPAAAQAAKANSSVGCIIERDGEEIFFVSATHKEVEAFRLGVQGGVASQRCMFGAYRAANLISPN
jgi:hypothetical protein